MRSGSWRGAAAVVAVLCGIGIATPAGAYEFWDGRIQIHGAMSQEFRTLADGYRLDSDVWYLSAMKTKLSVEIETELLPDGWGPFDIVEGFARLDFSYDCIWETPCRLPSQPTYFGDGANKLPKNLANAKSRGITGVLPNPLRPRQDEQPDHELLTVADFDPFSTLLSLGSPEDIQTTFGEILKAKISGIYATGSLHPITINIGPWNPEFEIDPTGSLANIPTAVQADLPMRPLLDQVPCPTHTTIPSKKGCLFVPSPGLRRRIHEYDNPDVNFTENELAWDLGASQQQTKFLREAYLDITMLDGRLQLRLGKQITRWGKTELFRAGTPDQLNPQDFAISNLPSFEESLIALWQARGIYSFYQVGPFEDVRLEVAINLDHFEPADLGDCGEPYTVFLVCQKQYGLLAHGFTGSGIAGERRPPRWWDDGDGLEVGARLEFRIGRFGVAITDFYGYEDFPTADWFQSFTRNVDPLTGRPRRIGRDGPCVTGSEPSCLTEGNAALYHPGNRQLYDTFCKATQTLEVPGDLGTLLPISACVIGIFNNTDELLPGLIPNVPALLSSILAEGDHFTESLICGLFCHVLGKGTSSPLASPFALPFSEDTSSIPLHPGLFDAASAMDRGLDFFLSPEQEALLGCGPFYNTVCHTDGIDLYNLEASVLFQRNLQTEHMGIPLNGAIGTRFVPGVGSVQLPGARSVFTYFDVPREYRWNPVVDGCVVGLDLLPDGAAIEADLLARGVSAAAIDQCDGYVVHRPDGDGPPFGIGPTGALATPDTSGIPYTLDEIRRMFPSEMAIVSENLIRLFVALDTIISGPAAGCALDTPLNCNFLNSIFETSAVQRPELRAGGNGRYGRRDMTWLSGAELDLFYERRNVLGVSLDFAEDWSQTTWGIDFTWIEDAPYINQRAENGYSKEDTLNLTMSIDRPTFVNFLNANRTIFFNSQLFLRYIPGYKRRDTFDVDGPFSLLATLTAFTGFWQDRLLAFMTVIHEVESNSGGQIFQMTYRYSESFSATVGLSTFYGEPSRQRVLDISPQTRFNTADFTQRTNFRGLSPIAQRDELFFILRKTF